MKKISLQESHLTFAKKLWSEKKGTSLTIIDATVGNGYDTLFLARTFLDDKRSRLYGFDIQEEALDHAASLLTRFVDEELAERVFFFLKSHEYLLDREADLIVYNLGYLPGASKSCTTLTSSTLRSVKKALEILKPGGLISMTCYPGHDEGKRETKTLLTFLESLDSKKYSCTHYFPVDKPDAPQLVTVVSLF